MEPPNDRGELLLIEGGTSGSEARGVDNDAVLEIRPLLGPDPIIELLGVGPPPRCTIVGVHAPATSRRIDTTDSVPGSLLHLLDSDGWSVTQFFGPATDPFRLGPDTVVREGRLPDACRRILGLPTAPPPPDMTQFVIDAWLSIVLRTALISPGLGWAEVMGLSLIHHLSASRIPPAQTNPAALAAAMCDHARSLDWHRYRRVCIALGGCPVSGLSEPHIAWMDAGMFSRWAHDALPSTAELLDLLEPTLGAAAFDRLWATVSLARPTPDRPDR